MSAVPSDTPAATQPEVPVGDVAKATPPPGKPPAGAPPEPQQPEVKSFFTTKPKAETKESLPDVSKLPAELQALYKSFQADYTKKTTEVAEWRKAVEQERMELRAEREAMQRNHEALLEALKGRNGQELPAGKPDVMAQVKALRAEGREDEADALFKQHVTETVQEQLAPMKEATAAENLKSSFQSTAMDVVTTNPLVGEYKADVVKVFDARNPMMDALRADILTSPERIKQYVPMVLNAIATEIHAKRLEETFDARVDAKVKQILEGNKAKAKSVPSTLLNTSGVSKESAPVRTGGPQALQAALERASERISSGEM